tara:strand:+ start:175 stop:498 length:324 start_codon:yes stop_codon:yes gene_type:complete
MFTFKELEVSILFLIICVLLEASPGTFKMVINDFTNLNFLIGLLFIVSFCLIILLNKKRDEEDYEKIVESVKKGLLALIIAYLSHLDLKFTPFWLVFIVACFFHDWV